MIRLVVANQRGGVAKTTTTVNLAWCYAVSGMRVLIIDTDPQASVSLMLGIRPKHTLYDFLVHGLVLSEAVEKGGHENISVLCSNRDTNRAEDQVSSMLAREFYFEHAFSPHDKAFDVVLLDCAPSIGLFQACAMIYARNVLIPVAMDSISVQGAMSALNAADSLNALFNLKPQVSTVGILPVMVNRRLQMTETVLESLPTLSSRYNVPMLSSIRIDASVAKAARDKRHLGAFDPKSKALEDYVAVADALRVQLEQRYEQAEAR